MRYINKSGMAFDVEVEFRDSLRIGNDVIYMDHSDAPNVWLSTEFGPGGMPDSPDVHDVTTDAAVAVADMLGWGWTRQLRAAGRGK